MVGVRSATAVKELLPRIACVGDGDDAATVAAVVIVDSFAALSLGARTRSLFAFLALLPMMCENARESLLGRRSLDVVAVRRDVVLKVAMIRVEQIWVRTGMSLTWVKRPPI